MTEVRWPVSVKAVVFNARREVLLLKNPRHEWELPGGRLELGESPRECLARELDEECGIVTAIGRALTPWAFEVIPNKHVLIVPFLCSVQDAPCLRLGDEHIEAAFFAEDALRALKLPSVYHSIIAEARAY